jgi:HEAT repeat protein
MIRRTLSLLALSGAFFTTSIHAQGDLQAAAEALSRGANEEALQILEQILAQDLSNEAAYELWSSTENRVWSQLLQRGGEIELLAREIVEKGRLGRKERENNPEAVRELVKQLASDDALQRAKVVHELGANYGEYAVPILVYSLAEGSDENRRINVIQALTRMGSDVVPPLIEALDAPDAMLRRNVALTLGYIRDPRAIPMLARAASQDADSSVRSAAEQSLSRLEAGGDAGRLFLAQGDAYYGEDPGVLSPFQYSDVVWRWEGNGLVSLEVPRFLYAPEMAKKAYYRALPLLPDSGPALAGIARCAVAETGRLAEWQAAGQDVGEWAERLQTDDLAAQIAGPAALDTALGWAIQQNDMIAASGLCRLLAGSGNQPTTNLKGALAASASGAVQGEAAVALGSIAYRNRTAADAATVSALTTAASREILRIGAVIGNGEDMNPIVAQLEELGYHTSLYPTGARGINSVRSLPGVDLIVVSDKLIDVTARNVVNDLRSEPRFAKTPIFVKTSAADADASRYGDTISGMIGPDEDIASAAEAAAAEPMNRDREEALLLASRAAQTLYKLAAGGQTDIQSSVASLASTLADRPDEVVAPALDVLQFVGGPAQVEGIAAVLASGERAEIVRVSAAQALAGIFSRSSSADAATVQMLQGVAQNDASFPVRAATAAALGQLDLGKDLRIELMRSLFNR